MCRRSGTRHALPPNAPTAPGDRGVSPKDRLAHAENELHGVDLTEYLDGESFLKASEVAIICGDGLIWFRALPRNQPANVQGIREKRLMGFEPTTFCMAIRKTTSALWPSISTICRDFVIGEAAHIPDEYARICADMPRVGHFRPGVPEIADPGLIRYQRVRRLCCSSRI